MRISKLTMALTVLLTTGSATLADDAGEAEYTDNCATCHGAAGMGQGPLAELMTVPVPDLTMLAARNDGRFPLLDVIMIIDGRTGVRGHGSSMPVWGDDFKAAAAEAGDYAAELEARGRILSLAYYLESIQKQ